MNFPSDVIAAAAAGAAWVAVVVAVVLVPVPHALPLRRQPPDTAEGVGA